MSVMSCSPRRRATSGRRTGRPPLPRRLVRHPVCGKTGGARERRKRTWHEEACRKPCRVLRPRPYRPMRLGWTAEGRLALRGAAWRRGGCVRGRRAPRAGNPCDAVPVSPLVAERRRGRLPAACGDTARIVSWRVPLPASMPVPAGRASRSPLGARRGFRFPLPRPVPYGFVPASPSPLSLTGLSPPSSACSR